VGLSFLSYTSTTEERNTPPSDGGGEFLKDKEIIAKMTNEFKNYKIKKKSRLWKIIPLAGRNRFSTTFGDTIYLTPSRYDDYQSGQPKNSTVALIHHEIVHVEQYKRDKHFKKNYLTDTRYRLQAEAEAYAKQAYIRDGQGSDTPSSRNRTFRIHRSTVNRGVSTPDADKHQRRLGSG